MSETLIMAGARTPFAAWGSGVNGKGAPGGALKELDPHDLGAAALKGALARARRSERPSDSPAAPACSR